MSFSTFKVSEMCPNNIDSRACGLVALATARLGMQLPCKAPKRVSISMTLGRTEGTLVPGRLEPSWPYVPPTSYCERHIVEVVFGLAEGAFLLRRFAMRREIRAIYIVDVQI